MELATSRRASEMRLVMHSLVLLPVRCPFLTNVRYYDSDWLSFQSYGSFDAFFACRCALLDQSLISAMSVAVQINVRLHYLLDFRLQDHLAPTSSSRSSSSNNNNSRAALEDLQDSLRVCRRTAAPAASTASALCLLAVPLALPTAPPARPTKRSRSN